MACDIPIESTISVLLDFVAKYEETYIVAVTSSPLLTINGWILMQKKVTGSSMSFYQNWAAFRDGFGSPTDNNIYWLGLDKVYRLVQLGSLKLRIEVDGINVIYCVFLCSKSHLYIP